MPESLYDQDFYKWTQQQGSLLRVLGNEWLRGGGAFLRRQAAIRPSHPREYALWLGLDFENLAEEIESLGKSERRSAGSYLRNVLHHLLKWQFQPELRSPSWASSISNGRDELSDILEESPSLKAHLVEMIDKRYPRALRDVQRETGLAHDVLSAARRYTPEQILDDGFWPGPPVVA